MSADPTVLTWNEAFGFVLSFEWNGNTDTLSSPWLELVGRLQRTLGPHYAGAELTRFDDVAPGITQSSFADGYSVMANWTDSVYETGGYGIAPGGFLARTDDGSVLAGAFADNFKKLGGTVTSTEAIAPTDTDMRPVLTKIAAGRPELIYYPIFIAAGGFITRQAKEVAGLSGVKLMSADGTFSPDFRKASGDSVVGVYNTSPDLSPQAMGGGYPTFLNKHKKKYGENPISAFHPHAYDAAMILFRAIERVGKKDSAGNLYIGRKALRDALFATRNYRGLTGTINCNQFGDCADPKIAVYQHVTADPAKWNAGVDPKKIYP